MIHEELCMLYGEYYPEYGVMISSNHRFYKNKQLQLNDSDSLVFCFGLQFVKGKLLYMCIWCNIQPNKKTAHSELFHLWPFKKMVKCHRTMFIIHCFFLLLSYSNPLTRCTFNLFHQVHLSLFKPRVEWTK